MPIPTMSPSELVAARERLGLSPRELAWELGVHHDVYAAYEDGRDKLSKKQSQIIAWRVAAADRAEALEKSGLPVCEWIEQWEREEPPRDEKLEVQVAYMERMAAHVPACDVCQARERFVAERFPEMPKLPEPAWARALGAVMAWTAARPEWMRPAIYGAGILAAMTSVRAVFMLIGGAREPRVLLMALGAILAGSLAGAGGGLVYSFIGRPARSLPVVGPYVAGMIAVAGYMGSVLALLALAGESTGSNGSPDGMLFAFVFVTLIFGPVVGYQLFRPAKGQG